MKTRSIGREPTGAARVFLGLSLALGLLAAPSAARSSQLLPCCAVVSVDKAGGTVTLRDHKTGRLGVIKVTDPANLAKLQAGQDADISIGVVLGAGMSSFGKQE